MWDRISNFVYEFVRDLSSTTFYIIMAILIVSGFYFLSLFLKANKKEAPKLAKFSYVLTAVFLIVVFVLLASIRKC